jgi:hypothetical protein
VADLQEFVAQLEAVVQRLGEATAVQHPHWYHARFAEIYDGGVEAFGPLGPDPMQRMAAELWFLLDCPLPDVHTPLWQMLSHNTLRAGELLARSELRAWRVASVVDDDGLVAICPRTGARVRLELVRAPAGAARPDCYLVARSVPLGPERWALLGPAPVVDAAAERDFEALLGSLGAPLAEFWRVHGGVLLRAASAWPETRAHTAEGELVCGSLSALELVDREAVLAALTTDVELTPSADGAHTWDWRWDPPAFRTPRAEPGVRYHLCADDGGEVPRLAVVDIESDHDSLWIMAPTPRRLALAERLLRARLGDGIGRVLSRDFLAPSVIPRWRRERVDVSPVAELHDRGAAA